MNNRRQPETIRVEDIKKIRSEMYIGMVLQEDILFDKFGERLMIPIRRYLVVRGIYPHLVQVEDRKKPGKLPIETRTYVELLLRRAKEEKGERYV